MSFHHTRHYRGGINFQDHIPANETLGQKYAKREMLYQQLRNLVDDPETMQKIDLSIWTNPDGSHPTCDDEIYRINEQIALLTMPLVRGDCEVQTAEILQR